ncbi:hypothetical protein GCM10023331_22560 [Algivirga pacifica]|uniref:histidine kinase n=2 Tax=Algivirga pacifica TaxID=1162670 RepID=A0ABP9DBH4_9BACT
MLVGEERMAIYALITGEVLFLFVFYTSFHLKRYTLSLFLLFTFNYAICIALWFSSAGLDGPVIMEFLFLQLLINLLASHKYYLWNIAIPIIVIGLLILISNEYPHLLIPYTSKISRESDLILTSLIGILLFGTTIPQFKKRMEWKKEKLAENLEALTESNLRYERLLEGIKGSFFLKHETLTREIIYLSPSADTLLGYPYEYLKKHFYNIVLESPENRQAIAERNRQLKLSKEAHYELIVQHGNGKQAHLLIQESIDYNTKGEAIGYSTLAEDITSRKISEQISEEALRKEQTLNQQKENFILTMSHQFKTPLTVIKSTNILLEKIFQSHIPSSEQTQFTKLITRQQAGIAEIQHLLNSLLEHKEMEHDSFAFSPVWTDLWDTLQDVIKLFKHPLSEQHRIDLQCNKLKHLRQPVYHDPKLVRHILNNIISNALKYSNSNIHISLSYARDHAIIQVQDYGVGIPTKDMEQLYHPFFRATNVQHTKGSGLGLSIAKSLIELHKGKIHIESSTDIGTIVTLEFPIHALVSNNSEITLPANTPVSTPNKL